MPLFLWDLPPCEEEALSACAISWLLRPVLVSSLTSIPPQPPPQPPPPPLHQLAPPPYMMSQCQCHSAITLIILLLPSLTQPPPCYYHLSHWKDTFNAQVPPTTFTFLPTRCVTVQCSYFMIKKGLGRIGCLSDGSHMLAATCAIFNTTAISRSLAAIM